MPTGPLDHDALRTVLEDAGLRCTPQRLAVYEHLTRAYHPTAEDVYRGVRGAIPKISLATVYKALEALVATGVASKLSGSTGDPSARYDARPDRHYHFRCLRTGAVHDLPTPFDPNLIAKLDPRLAADLSRQGFQVTGYRLELLGYQCEGSEIGAGAAACGSRVEGVGKDQPGRTNCGVDVPKGSATTSALFTPEREACLAWSSTNEFAPAPLPDPDDRIPKPGVGS